MSIEVTKFEDLDENLQKVLHRKWTVRSISPDYASEEERIKKQKEMLRELAMELYRLKMDDTLDED